jgi:SHS2 domain-containing protein
MPSGFCTFEHQADIGIRGFGPTLEEAFAQVALALFHLMVDDLQRVEMHKKIVVEAQGYDRESLLVVWLNTLISQADIHQMIFSSFNVSIQGLKVQAEILGEKYSVPKHGRGVEVKGATMTEVAVYKQREIWTAQCVVDV